MRVEAGPVIWSYWEGSCPHFIQLCLETLARWGNLRLLNRESFDELWRHDRDLNIDALYVAHRADFIRIYLLHHYGGVWIDADCIMLRSIAPGDATLDSCDLVCYREPSGTVSNNFLMAKPSTSVSRDYYDAVVSHIRERRPISWLELGSIPLTASIRRHPDAVRWLDTEMIMPVDWSESHKFLEAVPTESLEQADEGRGPLHGHRTICYMLSNHSLPESVKRMSREALLSSATLLGYLYRAALSPALQPGLAPNYRYWQRPDCDWQVEYERRKTRHVYYHIQELMITDHVAHHTPCRVLEWGCGTGRHLRNLVQIPDSEIHGFDQSVAMVGSGFRWASPEWRASNIVVGSPLERLHYPDKWFDIVFTCEALLHTRPEDLLVCLREMIRVCRGHIVHLESPSAWQGYSPAHDGCWGNDLRGAYASLGVSCRELPGAFSSQSAYIAKVDGQSVRWSWSEAMLSIYRDMNSAMEHGFAAVGAQALAG